MRKLGLIGAVVCACAWASVGGGTPARGDVSIDIVDGQVTSDWPAVASLETGVGTCSATLIGCRTILTAAHCVCDDEGTGPDCPDGTPLLDPDSYLVFFQQSGDQDPFSATFGQYPVESVEVAPGYLFGVGHDVALIKLAFPVRGIRPELSNTESSPPIPTAATIVGFGTSSLGGSDSGVKREGTATTGSCAPTVPGATHVCWTSPPNTTCDGDSGGALFADVGGGTMLAGVHSGGDPFCAVGGVGFDADVFVDEPWIQLEGGADLDATSCGDGPQVGDAQVTTTSFTGVVTTQVAHTFSVAAGTKLLRVALNAAIGSTPNDFDLLLRFNAPPTPGTNDCFPALLGSFEYCEIADPSPGTWHVRVDVFDGGPDEYQVTATQFPENPAPPALGSNDLLVADFTSWELMQVDGTTGDRVIQSSQLRGSGSMLAAPEGVDVDASGTVVVANVADRSLHEIDPTTGDRTVLSGCTDFPCGTLVGSGPEFLGPRFVAFENGDIVVVDRLGPGTAAVVRVDPGNGARSIVSGCLDPGCTSQMGTGPAFDEPFGIVVDALGDLIVADSFGLLSVDPVDGTRTLLSGGGTGSGENFRQPRDLKIEAGGDFLVVDGDPVAPALFHVDAGTGNRTVISGCANAACSTTVGSGPLFGTGLLGLQISGSNLLVTDAEQGTVFRVNRSSGARTVLSGCEDAACSSAAGSGPLFTAPAGVSLALPEPDAWLGLVAGIGLLAALRRARWT